MEPKTKVLKMAFNVDDDDLIAETQMNVVEVGEVGDLGDSGVSGDSGDSTEFLHSKFDRLERKIDTQAREIAACTNQVAKLTALLEVFLKGKASSNAVNMDFPIPTEDALGALDFALGRGMKEECTTAVTNLLKRAPLTKSLKNIIVEDLLIQFNIDGVSGKKKLKAFSNCYAVLINSVEK